MADLQSPKPITKSVKVKVVTEFMDKIILAATNDSRKAYKKVGEILEVDEQRAKELTALKFVKKV